MRELDTKKLTIITWDEKENIQIGSKKIRIIPAYEWLLETDTNTTM